MKRILFFVALMFLGFVALHFFRPITAQNIVYQSKNLFASDGLIGGLFTDDASLLVKNIDQKDKTLIKKESEDLTIKGDGIEVLDSVEDIVTDTPDTAVQPSKAITKQSKDNGTKVIITNLKNNTKIKEKTKSDIDKTLTKDEKTALLKKEVAKLVENIMENKATVVVSAINTDTNNKKPTTKTTTGKTTTTKTYQATENYQNTVQDQDVLVRFMGNVNY